MYKKLYFGQIIISFLDNKFVMSLIVAKLCTDMWIIQLTLCKMPNA